MRWFGGNISGSGSAYVRFSNQELQQYDRAPSQRPSRLRFAHTSPVYLAVDGKPAGVCQSLEEGLGMLDQLELYAQQHAATNRQEGFAHELMRGRAILKRRLDEVQGQDRGNSGR